MLRSLLILLLLLSAISAAADKLLYHESIDGILTDYKVAIQPESANTEYILTKRKEGKILSTERILTDPEGNTLEWDLDDPSARLEIHAKRHGNEIVAVKTEDGRTKEKSYRLQDNAPWHQLFPFGMDDFVTNGEEERYFWFIQPQNLKLSSMKAVRGEKTVLTVRGIRERAVAVEITINNWLSRFWKGLYLLRSRDGRYLFYNGVLRRNLSRGTVELITETP